MADRPDATGDRPGARWRSAPGAVRIASHVATWTAVLVPMFAELSRGWRPFGDDAAIASRSYQALSLHPPLTGLVSAASIGPGHSLFDPGPLLFFLLAIPVHVDPAHGLLWGAALFCGIALSASIEALWSTGQWLGGAVVAFTALDLVWRTPAVFENLAWNAYFPLPFFLVSIALAFVVATGKTRWWPVLVFTASVAAQSHLIFVVPGVALVVAALVLGLASSARPRRPWWLGAGLAVGALCWLAPVFQQVFDRHGNLTALVSSGRGETKLGAGFGLRMIGLAAAPRPLWLTHIPSGFYKMVSFEYGHSPWYGGVVLGLLAAIALGAFVTGRRALGALGVVSVAVSLGVFVSFAVFPYKNFISLAYLVDCLWVVGILIWAVVAWAVVSAGWAVFARVRGSAVALDPPSERAAPLVGWAGGLALAGLVVIGVLGIRPAATRPIEVDWNASDVALVARAATAIEKATPAGPVVVTVGPNTEPTFFLVAWSTEAIAYRLETDGWRPGVTGPAENYTQLAVPAGARWPSFQVTLRGTTVASVRRVG